MPDEGRDAVCRKARGICVVKLYELPTTFQMWSFFYHRSFIMAARYISYAKRGRPTREEMMTVIFDSYIKITNALRQLDDIYKREFHYRNQQYKNDINNKNS